MRAGRAGLPDGLHASLGQAGRFLGAGATAAALHYAVLVGAVEAGLLAPVPASCVGFAAGTALNYGLGRGFVFRSRRRHGEALPRYLAVAAAGLGVNAAVMAAGTALLGLPYLLAQVAATGAALLWHFAAHRLWTFREDERAA